MIQRPSLVPIFLLVVAMTCAPLLGAQTNSPEPQAHGTATPTAPVSGKLRLTDPQPLDPKELLAVQGIGGAVLRSRAHPQNDPAIADLVTHLQSLRAAIEAGLVMRPSALTVNLNGPAEAANPSAAKSVESSTAEVASAQPRLAAVESAVRMQLANVHQSRLRLQARPEGITDTALRSRRQTLADRTADLESATRAAMAAPVSDRYRMLLALRERLMSKSLREELAQIHSLQPGASTAAAGPSGSGAGSSADRVPTPTLTTLVQHR